MKMLFEATVLYDSGGVGRICIPDDNVILQQLLKSCEYA